MANGIGQNHDTKIAIVDKTNSKNVILLLITVLFHEKSNFPLLNGCYPDANAGTGTVDLRGQCMFTEHLHAVKTHAVALPAMKPGIYIIRLSGTVERAFKIAVSC